MRKILSVVALAAMGTAGLAAAASAPAGPVPAGAKDAPFFAGVHWDDDFDDRRRYGPMPMPNADAIRRAGIVQLVEIERDDGRIEVEGYDAQGRGMTLIMDRRGQRVLSARRDRHRDD